MNAIEEKKQIIFVNDRSKTQRGVQLEDGRIISLYDKENKLYLKFNYPIDLENGTFIPREKKDGETSLNDLNIKEVACYDMVDYEENVYPNEYIYTPSKVKSIKKYFKEQGYDVTDEAIKHQLFSWMGDYKSGYRDEQNCYHLFSPCGCNTLSIRLTTLHPLCQDWQETYAV